MIQNPKSKIQNPKLAMIAGFASLICFSAVAFSQQNKKMATISPQDLEFFEKKIRPVLAQNCYTCHSGGNRQGGLLLDTKENMLIGGNSGKAIVAGNLDQSLIIQVLRHTHARIKMPPSGKLPQTTIADFEKWITIGAPDPRTNNTTKSTTNSQWENVVAIRKKWWSLLPLKSAKTPIVKNKKWS